MQGLSKIIPHKNFIKTSAGTMSLQWYPQLTNRLLISGCSVMNGTPAGEAGT